MIVFPLVYVLFNSLFGYNQGRGREGRDREEKNSAPLFGLRRRGRKGGEGGRKGEEEH